MIQKKNTNPDFAELLRRQFAKEKSEWHSEPSYGIDGLKRWHWHASSLSECTRANILKRAGMGTDPVPLNSNLTTYTGSMVHALFERALPSNDLNIGVVCVEQGGAHRTLPLKAKPDGIIRWNDVLYCIDYKTGAGFGAKMRPIDYEDGCKPEHKLQITAGTMVAESRGLVAESINYGMLIYVERVDNSRNDYRIDVRTFEITQDMRDTVERKVFELEEAWRLYEETGQLPDRLDITTHPGKWKCLPMSKTNECGKWCQARSACYSLPPEVNNA